ncbi:Predicted arabinose efflux permease, MFS family [Dyadobacter soli]|uniref:Predicted arabinose efflux permease, MFS family n=1 Tax=Dyadobacter soli TaxID=659014 RepID=A0A1G7SHD7_9BACT|nr:MFS transporter [Dyadobacter soli]SDG22398.1 Predicted arabinose efflux permease, MFS family [Dyadobacter soli]
MEKVGSGSVMQMDARVFRCVLVVSLTGFLAGFDSIVISGINLPVRQLWGISDWFHGTFIVSIALWGSVAGALVGGYPTQRWGRKKALLLTGILFLIASLGSALSVSPYMFSAFRFIGGLASGIGSIAAPIYIAEVSNAKDRGKLGILFQINLVSGILLAYISNYVLAGVGDSADWRLMAGATGMIALVYTVLAMGIIESPRWYSGAIAKSRAAMSVTPNAMGLFSGKYTKILLVVLLMVFFNQFSGISFVLFYGPHVLERAGLGTSQSLLGGVSIGVVNLIATCIGMYFIDRVGRKQLMYAGSVGYILSLGLMALAFREGWDAAAILIFMLGFIFSHAIGQGAVIWVFMAEIFPTSVRAFGQAWGSGMLNVFAGLTTLMGPVLIGRFETWTIFAGFASLMVLQLLFVALLMPETRGATLEELENRLP